MGVSNPTRSIPTCRWRTTWDFALNDQEVAARRNPNDAVREGGSHPRAYPGAPTQAEDALRRCQQQRVALGRAIVRDPAVFLFDEPLSNLDAKLRVAMRSELIKLHHRLDTTMIYVTHDQIEAMTMGDRIVVMHEGGHPGRSVRPWRSTTTPTDAFVAGFIGSPAMNLIDGMAQPGDGVHHLPNRRIGHRSPGRNIRPRAAGPSPSASGPSSWTCSRPMAPSPLRGGFEAVEHLSVRTLSSNSRRRARRWSPAWPRNDGIFYGSDIHLWVDPANVMAFDQDSGKRLRG